MLLSPRCKIYGSCFPFYVHPIHVQAALLEQQLAERDTQLAAAREAAEDSEHKLSAVREYATSNVEELNAANDHVAALEAQLTAASTAFADKLAASAAEASSRLAELEAEIGKVGASSCCMSQFGHFLSPESPHGPNRCGEHPPSDAVRALIH